MRKLIVGATRACLIVGLVLDVTLEGTTMTEQEKLFQDASAARGEEYARVRDKLFELAPSAQAFLENQATAGAEPGDRWLAEILVARLANLDEFARLEKDFGEKVRLVIFRYPRVSRGGWPLARADLIGLRLPTESLPMKTSTGSDTPSDLLEFHRKTRIPDSDSWKPFLSEVLLKGWSPTSVPLAAEPKPLTEQELEIPRNRRPSLTSDDYLRQAVLLLGKLGEQRAAPRIAELLGDTSQDGRTRFLAARALGYLNSDLGMETLLRLVEDEQTPPGIRVEVFKALARLKDERAVPVLERIAADPDDTPLRGAYGPARWKSEARAVLMKIREK